MKRITLRYVDFELKICYRTSRCAAMAQSQPVVADNILVFRSRVATCDGLTIRDRMDVAVWRENARNFGYDRLVVHERQAGDPPEVGSFLSVYKRGEPWSRWGVTRTEGGVLAWCCVTGADVGRFATVEEALLALLPDQAPERQVTASPIPFPCPSATPASRLRAG